MIIFILLLLLIFTICYIENYFTIGVAFDVTFVDKDEVLWLVNFDQTNPKMHTMKKSGLNVINYYNSSFPCPRDQVVKSNHHTTGIYSSSPIKVLPPL